MLSRRLLVPSSQLRIAPTRLPCTPLSHGLRASQRFFSRVAPLQERAEAKARGGDSVKTKPARPAKSAKSAKSTKSIKSTKSTKPAKPERSGTRTGHLKLKEDDGQEGSDEKPARKTTRSVSSKAKSAAKETTARTIRKIMTDGKLVLATEESPASNVDKEVDQPLSLKEALLQGRIGGAAPIATSFEENLQIKSVNSRDLEFKAIDVPVPPIPMLSYGLDRVLFNPGVYRLQDPRSRIYNFDPYLEKIMKVNEFDFTALEEYKTSSRDPELLAMTENTGAKFTGSTSSMSGILQHFHFLLSSSRWLNHEMLSRSFPRPSERFSKITEGPSAVFLRWKDGVYAIDADKTYDTPNIMSWLGNSLEKLLTTEKDDFERYRRSNPEAAPAEMGGRCFHYSTQGNFLMRSQLDAVDPRLPGSGVFDLKTRAVVSIRMDHENHEKGQGYQLRYDRGEWESYEREFYDMTRSTMLKYSLQVRMGRMDGIFVAYHNIERIFGFQYLNISDLDLVLHGQSDPCLGDQEFRLSIHLLDEVMQKAIEKFPEQTLRFHFFTKTNKSPFMYIFAEPISDEEADAIQATGKASEERFKREVVGLGVDPNDGELQAEWHNIQDRLDEEIKGDQASELVTKGDEDAPDESAAEVEESENIEEEVEDDVEETEDDSEAEESVEETEDVEQEVQDIKDKLESVSGGPLAGWTLAIRNKVNGDYVHRPEKLKPEDDWSIEYHIRELPENSVWPLYNNVKDARGKLIGMDREKMRASLEHYRKIIHKYSQQGRVWRQEQDVIDEEIGQKIYEPLGPGSPKHKPEQE